MAPIPKGGTVAVTGAAGFIGMKVSVQANVRTTLEALRGANVRYNGPAIDTVEHLELPVDEIFVQQILRNLVTNAMDAFGDSEADDELHEVFVRVNADHDEYVDIEVSDNGPGIAEDVEIFEPFMTTKSEGVGLGLAVSRTLARSHGGDLLLLDRGRAANSDDRDARTTFALRLPRG